MKSLPDEWAEAMSLAIRDARRVDLASAAGNAVKSVLLFYSAPEHQVFLTAALLTAAATHRLRTGPALLVSFLTGLAAERAYLTMRNASDRLDEIAALGRSIQLNAQGPGDGGPDPARA